MPRPSTEELPVPSLSRPVLTLVPGSAADTRDHSPVGAFAPLDAAWAVPAESDDSWRIDALCAETDPEAFFPEKGGSTRDAKRVCTGCPVRAECLEFALANDERFGIWGGLSERERRRVRLQRRGTISA
ncbi:WhiB family transcriptional regulator [Blastococcus sp. KM273128]|nr:WhiB family transcriptional regulator [Blastococcus sp. KM273128]